MMCGLKMNNYLIQTRKSNEKESFNLSDMPPLEGDEEIKKEKY